MVKSFFTSRRGNWWCLLWFVCLFVVDFECGSNLVQEGKEYFLVVLFVDFVWIFLFFVLGKCLDTLFLRRWLIFLPKKNNLCCSHIVFLYLRSKDINTFVDVFIVLIVMHHVIMEFLPSSTIACIRNGYTIKDRKVWWRWQQLRIDWKWNEH
jgi:hypothetical protein